MLRPSWISLLLVACSTTPADAAILLQQATDASRAGQWDEAVRLNERALEQDDTLDAQAHALSAMLKALPTSRTSSESFERYLGPHHADTSRIRPFTPGMSRWLMTSATSTHLGRCSLW